VRFGVKAKILKVIELYKISPTRLIPAIILEPASEWEQFNLRMFFRLEPSSDSGITLYMESEEVNLIDISIGSAKFTHLKDNTASVDDTTADGPDHRRQVDRVRRPGGPRPARHGLYQPAFENRRSPVPWLATG
jgi:hypothetical protein